MTNAMNYFGLHGVTRKKLSQLDPQARRFVLTAELLESRLAMVASLSLAGPTGVVFEGERARFTLTLSEPLRTAEPVSITTVAGTATFGRDYFAPATAQILFSPGQTTKTFFVPTLRDPGGDVREGTETFQVVATPANAALGVNTNMVRIVDFVPPPDLRVTDVSVFEGNSGTTPAVFTVSLSATYPRSVTVAYATRDGSATSADLDYTAVSGSLTFAPGETSKMVSVTVNGDRKLETDETFSLVLSRPMNATLRKSVGIATIRNDEADAPGFQIDVRFDGSVTASVQQIFRQAAARLGEIIIGDVPGVTDNGEFIDDVVIGASTPAIDGVGGVLGQAGPTAVRPGAGGLIPFRGIMQFDSADIAQLERSGQLQAVVLHEMSHVLGFGSLWSTFGFVSGTTDDPVYTGANAVREYNAIFGSTGTTVPVEAGGGSGTALAHWRESTFDNELMTGYLNSGRPNPISRVTIGAFEDLGYRVNYSAADAYSRPAAARQGSLGSSLPALRVAVNRQTGSVTVVSGSTPTNPSNRPPSTIRQRLTGTTRPVSPTTPSQRANAFAGGLTTNTTPSTSSGGVQPDAGLSPPLPKSFSAVYKPVAVR